MTKRLNPQTAQWLGNRIREERISRGFTLVELGSECGVHHSQLSRIEQGKSALVSKKIENICTFLQIVPYKQNNETSEPLLSRVERLIVSSQISARAIESLVTVLEELTYG
ncbi:hypothetical protein C9383_09395 [Pseudomonas palleroniana]|nr:helix-turn-helix transcriptional regulator [Pseudomonas palleroniana]PTC28885.1 hypothetical protein C9383_09395 [Pseudomonas palleroniana]